MTMNGCSFGQFDVSVPGHDVTGPDGGKGGLEGYIGAGALAKEHGADVSAALARFTGDEPAIAGIGHEAAFKKNAGPLQPGQYKLACWYADAPDKRDKPKEGDVPTWVGEAVTNEVPAAPATARNARRRESARNSWIRSS